MNVSSIVVQVKQEKYDELVSLLEESHICDFHFGDKSRGKIIITIEGENVGEEIKKLTTIQTMPNVIAADMMQTYQEELDQAVKDLEASSEIPTMLNDDSIEAKDIVYHGDLKKKDYLFNGQGKPD